MKIKIIIIGFGSIGQRHYKNLLKLGYKDVYVYDPNKKKINSNNLKRVSRINVKELEQFDIAFICNPNNLHIKIVLQCTQAGCDLFIEKPLSHNLKDLDKLNKVCQQKKLVNMVACNLRFHPCLRFIKNYLNKGGLGKIYSIHHEFGYYLPYWRPKQDYRKNYAAKKSTGGGIILDDIHEFDLLFWLNDFKDVKEAKFIYGKVSDLKIETEDICSASFKFKNKVVGSIKCDYLQQKYNRNCKIVGEKGNLEWDWNENVVWLETAKSRKKIFNIKKYDLNKMYLEELKYFMNCVDKRKNSFNNIKIAKKVLKYCVSKK